MKKIFVEFILMVFTIWLVSCKPVEGDQVGTVTSVNSDSLTKMQKSICVNGEQLTEVDYGSVAKVYGSLTNYNAFGFLKGTGRCALKKDFSRNGILDEWLSLTLYDSCLANGTLWTLKTSSTADNSTWAQFVEFGGSADKVTRLRAGYSVKLRELNSNFGMKFYKCVPE